MANVKGTTLVMMRKLLREAGEKAENEFLEQLTPEDRELYLNVTPPIWVPVETAYRICLQAAPLLGCVSEHPILELVKKTSPLNFATVYKIFIRVASIPFIIRKAAAIWATVNDAGAASVENIKPNQADFVLKEYSAKHTYIYEATSAHILTLLNMAGAKNIRVEYRDENPNTIRWCISWR